MAESISRALARYVCGLSFEQLPADVVYWTRLTFLDWLGNALAGSQTEPSQWVQAVAADSGGRRQATLLTPRPSAPWLANRDQSSVLWASLVNGTSSHMIELDDVHKKAIIHAGTVVIPGALALAEHLGVSGRRFMESVVAGFDVCIRIGEAVTPSHYRFFHTTGTVGTFGAAAAAAKLLGLSEEQTVHALGTAGTQAAGLWEFIENGSMSKHLHAGKAAWNGVFAALLAARGVTGAETILEGKRGFFRAMAAEVDEGCITAGLGERYKIAENCFKIHASCRHTHHAVDLALQLVHAHDIQPNEVEAVEVATYPVALDITDNPHPQSVYAAKFSLQYCVALAVARRSAGWADFTEETLWDPVIRRLLARVQVSVDPDCAAKYPECWAARVTIRTYDGRSWEAATDYPKGDFENPVSEADLVAKFYSLSTTCLSHEEASVLCRRVERLEALPSMAALFASET
ncbi:MAG: MmgE/PrpD family protein [Alicyclobacillaceae bacterium]|nr:MmgE/PrpD family protein [Alicyclobacillaceae bacterium]